eukprot:gene7737-10512_t
MIVKFLITRIWGCIPSNNKVEKLDFRTTLRVVVPIGLMTAADVVLSNKSIVYLPLSMYTVLKSANLVFIFMWGILLGVEKFQCKLFSSILCVSIGIGVAVFTSSSKLNVLGVVLILCACAAGGLRWVSIQILVDIDTEAHDSMRTLFRIAPYTVICLIPFAVVFEWPTLIKSVFLTDRNLFFYTIGTISSGGAISLLLLLAEVKLLELTSSLTLGVVGQIKEVLQILLAMLLYKDKLNIRSLLGICLSIIATCFYRHLRNIGGVIDEQQSTKKLTNQYYNSLPTTDCDDSYEYNNDNIGDDVEMSDIQS